MSKGKITKQELSKELADEFNSINQHLADKAEGNHNHNGVYEPVLPTNRKRKITFGTSNPTGGSDGDIYFQYE